MSVQALKPLGRRAYGHIPHLPGSRMGPADHHCHEGQSRICTEKPRDRNDVVIVTEKLDGTCVSVANIDGCIVPLIRAGYPAISARYEQHHLFAAWAYEQEERFRESLAPGERFVGEWLAQAHGTRYSLPHEPFVVFDLMRADKRAPFEELCVKARRFITPRVVSIGSPLSITKAVDAIGVSAHGAMDPVEGAVWRVERRGEFDFIAKYVRPDKVDGAYLPEINGSVPVWNWRPNEAAHV